MNKEWKVVFYEKGKHAEEYKCEEKEFIDIMKYVMNLRTKKLKKEEEKD